MNENIPGVPAGDLVADAVNPKIWKSDWDAARKAMTGWWKGTDLAVSIQAPKDEPWEDIPPAAPASSNEQRWLDPRWRVHSELYRLSRIYFGGTAFPIMDTMMGPGSLGQFLGAKGNLDADTVWYEPNITDPENHAPLKFNPDNLSVKQHVAMLEYARRYAPGRCLRSIPDIIENIDTLAELRGSQTVLMDLIERPEWVEESIRQINAAWLEAYDYIVEAGHMTDPWGATVFHSLFGAWGYGRSAKVQCDFCCMISPKMFGRFVAPYLREQCSWVDNSLYHLDGTNALPQLDQLLAIDTLNAIEWTPQSGIPQGGSPEWYDLYRKIKAAGKSVEAILVEYDEVEPLIDAVGGEGMLILTTAPSETAARKLLGRLGWPV